MDRVAFAALGTTAHVAVTGQDTLPRARELLNAELEAIDRACSRFRTDSELRRLELAAGEEIAASDLLVEALETALRAARLTDGLVTPTLGASLRLAGYDRDFDALTASSTAAARLPAPSWEDITVDRQRGTACVPAGVELDLGATAKALAADRAATRIETELGCGVLVSLGGDIRVAGSAPEGGWPIVVDDDHPTYGVAVDQVTIRSGGLATSSTTRRRWRRGSEELHHILDPHTGSPASGPWRTATVVAGTCVDANVAATASILLGPLAPAWLEHHGLPALLVRRDGGLVAVGGWPEERAA